ncbi:hypothetical protein CSKR_203101 [Clonorchis sinensis]|uniref:Uncharacterized protein n=1 Tax=Clonorchis sinensis TaxID=79923 RepID=A0A8T1M7T4_CLOSI|nr:hypothetical protein CSKR_203101 [Clonorchis sinensis]
MSATPNAVDAFVDFTPWYDGLRLLNEAEEAERISLTLNFKIRTVEKAAAVPQDEGH